MTKAAIIGGGVIGGGWAARFLLNGWDVAVYDPDPEAGRKLDAVLANARRALPALYDVALPAEGALTLTHDLAEAVAGAAWVQESVPERLEVKHKVLADLTRLAPGDAIIASSTSGFKPSELTAEGARCIVAHPFNPVYLLPLIELVGDPALCARAAGILTDLGLYPLQVRKEIDAHIADRFLEAVWREALWLVKDGIATTEEIDEAIRMGFGLRWGQMGLFETYRVAGGEAGMRHFLAQFGPALKWPWTKLMDVPVFDDDLVDLIAGQSDAQSGHLSIRALERRRDDNLVAMMRALKRTGQAAGQVLRDHEAGLPYGPGPLVVPPDWAGPDGLVPASRLQEIAEGATGAVLQRLGIAVGVGEGFVAVQSTLTRHGPLRSGEVYRVDTERPVLQGETLRLTHVLRGSEDLLVATVEVTLSHVDLASLDAAPLPPALAAALAGAAA